MRLGIFKNTDYRKMPVQQSAEIAELNKRIGELEKQPKPGAFYSGNGYNRVYAMPFDGEKNLGELGPIRRYAMDYDALRLRSWQLYLESEVCQTVIKRFARWVVGKGLKLQAEPQKEVLATEKINIEPEDFNKVVEPRFRVFANSKIADYSNSRNLHKIGREAFINAMMGGDVLVILRYINNEVKVQIVDGSHVKTPLDARFNGVEHFAANGNRIRYGIELGKTGEHTAYYVRTGDALSFKYERVPARGARSGALMAFMVYGLKYRLDSVRGIPLLTAVMETVKKMERYKEATIGSAEERQKISYFITHGKHSDGTNPLLQRAATAYDLTNAPGNGLPQTVDGTQLANQVIASTNKMTFNLPNDADIKSLEADNELYFKDFYTVNIDLVCATVDIPPNVAMSKYDSNYSASRAALKDWEHTLDDERKAFADQFYAPIYWFWLETQVLTNKVQAPGYMQALANGNNMAIEAYRYARFVGANVPHIDPEKEVRAQRLALGDSAANVPLTTVEAATEALNNGDYGSNVMQFGKEMEKAQEQGIAAVQQNTAPPAEEEEEKTEEENKDD